MSEEYYYTNFFDAASFCQATNDQQGLENRLATVQPQKEKEAKEGPIGLKLQKSPYFMDLIERNVFRRIKTSSSSNHVEDVMIMASADSTTVSHATKAKGKARPYTNSDKLKASNFNASFLQIGSWQKMARNEGDIVAKCYYAKRKLVWEILEFGLKSKIEIQWSDIIGIRAFLEPNQPGVLEIELKQPPSFHRETDPQPKKHTMWSRTSDFTDGQASLSRRHCAQFPPGSLDRHYHNLLQYDMRLFELSKKPFPSLNSLYFTPPNFYEEIEESFPINFNGDSSQFPINFNVDDRSQMISCHDLQLPYSISPMPMNLLSSQTYQQPNQMAYDYIKHSTSPTSVMDYATPLQEVMSSYSEAENPWMAVNQAEAGRVQVQGTTTFAPTNEVNYPLSWENMVTFSDQEAFGEIPNSDNQIFMNHTDQFGEFHHYQNHNFY